MGAEYGGCIDSGGPMRTRVAGGDPPTAQSGYKSGELLSVRHRSLLRSQLSDLSQDAGTIFELWIIWDFTAGTELYSCLSALWIFLIILDLVDYLTDFSMTLEELVGSNSTDKK